MGLIRKLQFFVKIEISFSALDLLYYWEESNETLEEEYISPGYWYSRAAKNVPMGLIRKLQFFVKIEISFSAQDLLYYWEESNETLYRGRIYIVLVHLGIGFLARRKMTPWDLFAIAIFFVKSNSAFPR